MVPPLPTSLDTADPAVATRSLVKRYGGRPVLSGVELTVPEGAVYALLGPNGAGKSTLLGILLDLVRADEGTAHVFGIDTRRDAARIRAGIGYVPEGNDVPYGWMRVGELVRHHAAYFPAWDPAYAAELVRRLRIDPAARWRSLSKGESRRVQLLLALAHRPPLLLLDEPTDGLDPLTRDAVLEILAEHLAERPTTILWSTHLVHEVERLADHIGILREGRLLAQVARDDLHRSLRRYHARVPEAWEGSGVRGPVLRRDGAAREIAWTVWGNEEQVTEQLAGAGATVHRAVPLSLEEAALTLLGTEPGGEG